MSGPSMSRILIVDDELEQLKLAQDQGKDLKALLQEEVRLLQEDISLRTDYIKTLLNQM